MKYWFIRPAFHEIGVSFHPCYTFDEVINCQDWRIVVRSETVNSCSSLDAHIFAVQRQFKGLQVHCFHSLQDKFKQKTPNKQTNKQTSKQTNNRSGLYKSNIILQG